MSPTSVYAVGERSGFPDKALAEHWNGSSWSVLNSPADSTESLLAYGVTGTDSALTVVGNRASDTAPFTTLVATGAPSDLELLNTPNATGENNLYAATTAADGTTYAAGWSIDPATDAYLSEILHCVNSHYSRETSPNPGSDSNGFADITANPAADSGPSASPPTKPTTPPSSPTTADTPTNPSHDCSSVVSCN